MRTIHPLVVHIADAQSMRQWAVEIQNTARLLAETFWPGPLAVILKRKPHMLDAVTCEQDSVGLRVPALVRALGGHYGRGAVAN